MAVSDGETITVVKDMGLVSIGLRQADPPLAAGRPGSRSCPIFHDRPEHLAQRPAGVPLGRSEPASPSATTAT